MNDRSHLTIKNLLTLNTALCASVAFMSCRSVINSLYAALYLAVLGVAVAVDLTGRRHPPRAVINVMSIAVLAAAGMRVRIDMLIEIFTEAVMMMTAMKALEEKTARDYCQIAALSAFAVISAAVMAIDGAFLYYCVLISFLTGFQMLLAAWYKNDRASVLSIREAGQAAGRAAVIWAMMLPVCLLLFFSAPRAMTTLGQFQRVPGDDVSFTGFSDEIEFGSVRRIQESNALAFRVEMPEMPGGGLYWRGIVLDAFNGRMWRSTRMPGARSVPQPEEETVRQEIYLEPGYHSILFALDKPVHINEAGAFPAGDAVFMNRRYRLMGRLNYTAFSSVSPTLRPDPPDVRRDRYLSLPDDFIPGLKGVLGDITSGLRPDEYPGAIMAWLAPPRFDYSLEDLPSAGNPMEDFFFTHRMGNCEYFASAMAVMLRMAGIPSRLVAGYHGGIYNDSGSYYMVNQSNAHVWVEAWDDAEKLWRRYDPTPISGGGASGGTAASEYGRFRMYLDLVNHLISRAFVGYSRESQSRLLRGARSFMSDPSVRVYSFLERIQAAPRAWIIAFSCILGAASLAAAVRFSRRRVFGGSASHEAVVREKFIRLMEKLGWRHRAGDGLEEFVESMRGDPRFGEAFFDMAFEFVTEFEEFYFRDIPMDSGDRARFEKLLKRMKANAGNEAVARAGRTAKIRKQ